MRLIRVTLASVLAAALTPLALGAQGAAFPRCKDGTVATRTGYTACWFHGGVDDGRTVAKAKPAAPAPARSAAVPRKSSPGASARPAAKSSSRSTRHASAGVKKASKEKPKSKAKAKAKSAKSTKAKPATTVFGVQVASASKAGATKPRTTSRPKAKPAPKGATARCMDGSYTDAKRKKKACSKHGGVAGWIKPDIPPE